MPGRSLTIQSVLYNSSTRDVMRAAEAMTNSVGFAIKAGEVSEWTYLAGDCSPKPVFTKKDVAALSRLVQAQGGTFRYEVFGDNLGSAEGHNALARLTDTELILILNPDALVAPDTITSLARTLVGDVGIAESRQIPVEHPKTYDELTGDTSWASTACAMTTRVAFDLVDGFDSSTFFLYCDDVDYSWKLRLAGLRAVYQPAARVFHDKRLTITGDWIGTPAEHYYSAEAALLLAHKYSRPDVVRRIRKAFSTSRIDEQQRALAEFDRRAAAGLLPDPVDRQHRVAEFIDGNYAEHRL